MVSPTLCYLTVRTGLTRAEALEGSRKNRRLAAIGHTSGLLRLERAGREAFAAQEERHAQEPVADSITPNVHPRGLDVLPREHSNWGPFIRIGTVQFEKAAVQADYDDDGYFGEVLELLFIHTTQGDCLAFVLDVDYFQENIQGSHAASSDPAASTFSTIRHECLHSFDTRILSNPEFLKLVSPDAAFASLARGDIDQFVSVARAEWECTYEPLSLGLGTRYLHDSFGAITNNYGSLIWWPFRYVQKDLTRKRVDPFVEALHEAGVVSSTGVLAPDATASGTYTESGLRGEDDGEDEQHPYI
ncbi:Hypothetical predicted protein [Lecanosticta acicola]|uniref:Uncharacterized protein n=1 Tax=Lecanosticta acicola TaxID=111012 RepID=A0AAI9E8S7_9PEZI|nr:Hypothetical predicted protein [Lecanosticta acicola]